MAVAPRVNKGRRPALVALLVVLCLLVLCVAVQKVHADVVNVADPDVGASDRAHEDVDAGPASTTASSSSSASFAEYEAHLGKMTEEQLKKTLVDRFNGKKIDWKKYATSDAIIEALLAEDREEARRKAFLARVDEALVKRAKTPLRDDTHTVNIVYCVDTGYADDVHRYEAALFEEKAALSKAEALAKKAKKEKKSSNGDVNNEATPQTVTFTQFERSFFLPNAKSVTFTSEKFPLPRANQIKFQVLSTVFIATIALSIFVGQLTFLPESLRTYLANHRTLLVSTAMMFNMFSNTVRRTGAFEVYVDGSLVYSHLARGGTKAPLPSIGFMSELLVDATLLKPYGV